MEDLINNKVPIDIEYDHGNEKKIYSGVCIFSNSDIFVLYNFEESISDFDGISILLNEGVKKYREFENEELLNVPKNFNQNYIDKLKINGDSTLTSCLQNIPKNVLIAVYLEQISDYYLVGKIETVNEGQLELYQIDTEGKWTERTVVKINEICYVGYDTSYEQELIKNTTQHNK